VCKDCADAPAQLAALREAAARVRNGILQPFALSNPTHYHVRADAVDALKSALDAAKGDK
jgi:DNA-binding FrmR family transcriptional regulator